MNKPWTNERGNKVSGEFHLHRDRYHYDFEECAPALGWKQYDTDQDAWYFGVWVHVEYRKIMTWAEGDESTVECPTPESFRAELAHMAEFYGSPPPAAVGIDDDGTVTEYYDTRPEAP